MKLQLQLQQVLQHTTSLLALISILTYCILVATGNYKKWSLPILIGVSLCKLLSVRRSHRSSLQAAGSSSSSSVVNTFRQRLFLANYNFNSSSSPSSCCCKLLRSIYHTLHHRISNDSNLYILSTLIILLPCLTFYICRVVRHLTTPFDDNDNTANDSSNSNYNYNHKELANDFGKLSAASLSFLLLPISKYSNLLPLLGSSGNNEVHVVRMHIYAGYLALLGGILHGLYYI